MYRPDEHFDVESDTMLVNSVSWPHPEVEGRKHRFRVLAASNAAHYTLALSSGRPSPK